MARTIPLSINFDESNIVGGVTIGDGLSFPQLEQYYILPSYARDDSGQIVVTGYSLVHRSLAASDDEMKRREGHLYL